MLLGGKRTGNQHVIYCQLSQFQNVPFRSLRLSVRYLSQAQILILEILHVFLRLKFSPSLISNKIEHFETGSAD